MKKKKFTPHCLLRETDDDDVRKTLKQKEESIPNMKNKQKKDNK